MSYKGVRKRKIFILLTYKELLNSVSDIAKIRYIFLRVVKSIIA